MANITIIDDKVSKDEMGNGLFELRMKKNKFIGKSEKYTFKIYRNENEKLSGCLLEKYMMEGNKAYIYELHFDEQNPTNNIMTYRKVDFGYDHTFNLLTSDVMFNTKLKKEENKVLAEFDKVMWFESKHSSSKATLIDVFTDVIDTTEKDDTEIDGKKVTDVQIIHTAVKGFFAEVKPNVSLVEF